ncbi:MAG TPA: gluconeogenesis factor YvcK family protein [Candidatus Paceibacterota bacterium]|nr:gluconeogenesis factor YvcK family protein [Candidatus Paceibacterota bacterium]
MTKRIVTIGGGTGTFVVLSGLRRIDGVSLTAIVSSADDGGSTGRLRDAYGILPPGDARQALVALAEEDTILRELFAYRFSKGDVAGHNLGNLFITALSGLLGSDTAAIQEASRILRIKGQVLSASERPASLVAHLADGTLVIGEHFIDKRVLDRPRITNLTCAEPVLFATAARRAIGEADLVVLGPGDLYTSTIAALLPNGAQAALAKTEGKIAYVMNLFTKAGQTSGYAASDHLREVERYMGRPVDMIILNADGFTTDALAQYESEGEYPVVDDLGSDPRVVRANLASVAVVPPLPEDPVPRSLIRHDTLALARALERYLFSLPD